MVKKKRSRKKDLMSGLDDMAKGDLIRIVMDQRKIIESEKNQKDQFRNRIKDLNDEIGKLEDEVKKLTKRLNSPAAPFRIPEKKRKKEKRKSGRKAGHPGSYRKVPETVDDQIKVCLDECPHCAGPISNVQELEQYIEEIPPMRKRVIHLKTYTGQCANCGEVESDHPLKVSHATGAAKCHLGANAQALAVQLLYDFKLTRSKTARLLKQLYGLKISRGGLVHLSHKFKKRCESHYEQLAQEVRKADVLYADETSWYVGIPGHFLWFFGNEDLAFYRVADNRRRENIYDIIGEHFQGVLSSDCLSIYDGVNPIQQKCYAHHFKAISSAMDKFENRKNPYLRQIQQLLKTATLLKELKGNISTEQFDKAIKNLAEQADQLLDRPRDNPVEEGIANRLRKQKDHLFTFLIHDGVDSTNNLAERMLRPAIISRKVSCGNKTNKGAQTWQVLTSLLTTNQLRNADNKHFLTQFTRPST